MDTKSLTIEALDAWSSELIQARFLLRRIRSDKKILDKAEADAKAKLREIKRNINQELDANGKIIRNITGQEED